MKSAVQQEILKENIWPLVCDPKHTSKSAYKWLKTFIKTEAFEVALSKLNLDPMLFHDVKQTKPAQKHSIVEEEWAEIPLYWCQRLIAHYHTDCHRKYLLHTSNNLPALKSWIPL